MHHALNRGLGMLAPGGVWREELQQRALQHKKGASSPPQSQGPLQLCSGPVETKGQGQLHFVELLVKVV